MEKIVAIIQLIRPINCTVMGAAVLVGMIVAAQTFLLDGKTAFLGFITGFTFLAAANAVNDYYDRNIDAVNEPNRPIPSGVIQPKEALGYVFILSAIGFLTAFSTNAHSLAIAIIAWLLSMYYAMMGKRTGVFGNFVVSTCVALPFIYGGFAVESGPSLTIILFAAMAFFSTVGREITKGIVDVEGDKLQSVKTVAVLYGSRTAAMTAAFFIVVAVVLSIFPWILGKVSVWYLPLVILADVGFISSSILLLRNYSRENARTVKRIILACMVMGLLAFIAGILGG
jgi:geranylgeranylglycerol-phosphate geranylgeranyltransferase